MIEDFDSTGVDEGIGDQPLPFTGLKKGEASRAIQTFFRTSFRTHVSLVSMVDRKASIMLKLNSYLVSGGLVLFKYISENSDVSILTIILFLATTITSMILAAIVTRPYKDITGKDKSKTPDKATESLFFFNHYVNMDKEKYVEAFGVLLKDAGLIYKNMAMDLYKYAKTIDFKYRLLRMSYNVFVFGFIATIISFIIDNMNII